MWKKYDHVQWTNKDGALEKGTVVDVYTSGEVLVQNLKGRRSILPAESLAQLVKT